MTYESLSNKYQEKLSCFGGADSSLKPQAESQMHCSLGKFAVSTMGS